MNCIAIDDEPLALNIIREFCDKIDFIHLIGTYTNAIEATREISKNKVDLIFIDIEMPHISGIDYIKTLNYSPLIIFTTALTQHALEGFELNAVDYLLKPIPFERFFKGVNKAYELFNFRNSEVEEIEVEKVEKQPDYVMIKVEHSTVRINFSDILYIEGLKDYVKIYINEKPILTKATMKKMMENLPIDSFIRVHKSFIVAINKIDKIENNRVIISKKYIPVGDSFKKSFYLLLDKFRI